MTFLKYNLHLFSLYLQCSGNSYPIQLNLCLPRATDLLVPKSELQGLISHKEWAGPFHFLLRHAMFFLLTGGVFPSHYPNYCPGNAVLNCISLIADLKEKIHTDFFDVLFFFFFHFAFHLQARQLNTCKAEAL